MAAFRAAVAWFFGGAPSETNVKYFSNVFAPTALDVGLMYVELAADPSGITGMIFPSCKSSLKKVAAVGPSVSVMITCGCAAIRRATSER